MSEKSQIKITQRLTRKFHDLVRVKLRWTNANRKPPPENRVVLLRRLKHNDEIIRAQFGKWDHAGDGEYTSWHYGQTFIDYRDDGQYWMEIPQLP